jgi:hypothetical protein
LDRRRSFELRSYYVLRETKRTYHKKSLTSFLSFLNSNLKLRYFTILFYLLENEAESNKIDWQNNWAVGCNFSSFFEIISLQVTNITECSKKCEKLYECTHFTFELISGMCSLRYGQVDQSSVNKTNRNFGCGLTLNTNESSKVQFNK